MKFKSIQCMLFQIEKTFLAVDSDKPLKAHSNQVELSYLRLWIRFHAIIEFYVIHGRCKAHTEMLMDGHWANRKYWCCAENSVHSCKNNHARHFWSHSKLPSKKRSNLTENIVFLVNFVFKRHFVLDALILRNIRCWKLDLI